jgi:8-hydroxy-5-deazaflavin:NADPH oxidoreductase
MTIGIVGAGAISQALATQLARAGIDTLISNSRGPHTLTTVVEALGPRVRAVTAPEAAALDLVVLAVPWHRLREALTPLPPWNGRIVIDTTNPLVPAGVPPPDLGGRTSSEIVADLLPGARLVKAFNTLPPRLVAADPHEAGGRRVVFFSGNDVPAKAEVGELIGRLGFAGVDLGDLATGGKLQQYPGGPLPTLNLIRLR